MSADGNSFVDALTIDRNSGALKFSATNMAHDCAINLYQDSGSFAGNHSSGITIGSFVLPSYLSLFKGSNAVGLAKSIQDNSDHSGAGGAQHPPVADLVAQIRDPGATRRYGSQYWVAQFIAGTGHSRR